MRRTGLGNDRHEEDPMSKPIKGTKSSDSWGGKAEPTSKGGKDVGRSSNNPTGKGEAGEAGEEFLKDRFETVGRTDASGGGPPGRDSIEDRFGTGRSGNPADDHHGDVGDLLAPELPTRHGDAGGPADWTDGPTDRSGGVTTGVDVANVADDGSTIHYDQTDSQDIHWTEEEDGNFIAANREGGFDRISPDLLVRQSAAPGSTDGAVLSGHPDLVDQSSETVTFIDDAGNETQATLNRQSLPIDTSYEFNDDGEFLAVDPHGNATVADPNDVHPHYVHEATMDKFAADAYDEATSAAVDAAVAEANAEAAAQAATAAEKKFAAIYESEGDSQAARDAAVAADEAQQAAEEADAEAAEKQAAADQAFDDAADAADAADATQTGETPDEDYDEAEIRRREAQGDEVERKAGLDRDDPRDIGRRDPSGDDVDPNEHDTTVEGGSGQPTNDAGVSNPEGTEPSGGPSQNQGPVRAGADPHPDDAVAGEGRELDTDVSANTNPDGELAHLNPANQQEQFLDPDELRDGRSVVDAPSGAGSGTDSDGDPNALDTVEIADDPNLLDGVTVADQADDGDPDSLDSADTSGDPAALDEFRPAEPTEDQPVDDPTLQPPPEPGASDDDQFGDGSTGGASEIDLVTSDDPLDHTPTDDDSLVTNVVSDSGADSDPVESTFSDLDGAPVATQYEHIDDLQPVDQFDDDDVVD